MWIGIDITGSFHSQFEVLYELEQMRGYDAMT
jgi:hypothetical protein